MPATSVAVHVHAVAAVAADVVAAVAVAGHSPGSPDHFYSKI